MANNVARLGVVLGLNTAEFISGIENASKRLDRFAKSIDQYAKYGATALAAMSVAALKLADDIADVADANDVAIDTVVKLRMALNASGGSADKAGAMLSAFTKFIDTAADGSFEAQKAFKSVGVSLKDIGSMTQEQLLSKVLSGLDQMGDTVTRNARAYDFFSKAAKGVAFDKIAQEMSNTTALTREQIGAVKAGAETWDNLQKIISQVQLLFINALGPSLEAINSTINDETFPKIRILGEAFNFMASNIYSAYKAMQSVAILLEKIAGYSVIMQTYGESNARAAELKRFDAEIDKRLADLKNQQAEFDKILGGDKTSFPTNKNPKWGQSKDDTADSSKQSRPTIVGEDVKAKAAKAEADAIARQTKQLEAQLVLTEKQTKQEELRNEVRLLSINKSGTELEIAKTFLQLYEKEATIENARAVALSNEKLTTKQKELINKDFNLQTKLANDEQKRDTEYLLALQKRMLTLNTEESVGRDELLKIDGQIADQQRESLTMDKLKAGLEANTLQHRREIFRINQEQYEVTLKPGVTLDEVDNSRIIQRDAKKKANQDLAKSNEIITAQYQQQLDVINKLDGVQNQTFMLDRKALLLEKSSYSMREDEVRIAQEKLALEKKIADLRNQQTDAGLLGKGDMRTAEQERLERQIKNEQELSLLRQQAISEEYSRQQSFIVGWNDAFNSYMQNATNAASLGGQAFSSVMGNMNSALDTFVDTGKFSFADFTRSIIRDLIKIKLHAQAAQIFGGQAGGLGDLLFKTFGGVGTGDVPNAYASSTTASFTKASGGTVSSNTPYLVGERGPEMFVPGASGTIIPTNNLASAMGGGGQTVNYNGPYIASMSAIDTQSGMQFLAKNKQTIWASYQSANRSVSVSR